MSKPTKRPEGKPPKPARELARGAEAGTVRFSLELPEALLVQIERLARADARQRNAQIRVLLAEAVAARKAEREK